MDLFHKGIPSTRPSLFLFVFRHFTTSLSWNLGWTTARRLDGKPRHPPSTDSFPNVPPTRIHRPGLGFRPRHRIQHTKSLDPIPTERRRSHQPPTMKSATLLAAALVAVANALPDNIWSRHWVKGNGKIAARYVKGTQTAAQPPVLNAPTVHGCYKSSGDLKFVEVPEYNSVGKCGGIICPGAGYPVGGSTGGNQCWCGQTYPPKADLIDDSNCDVGCTGYGQEACESSPTVTCHSKATNQGDKAAVSMPSPSITPG